MGRVDVRTQTLETVPLVVVIDSVSEVLRGLQAEPKTLPTKMFYDQYGSQLFDQICELDEYYPTRTETAIMQANIAEIANEVGPDVVMIEYGSGSSLKTRLLLDHLPDMDAYVPVDISQDHLYQTAEILTKTYPHLEIFPVWADFTQPFSIPGPHGHSARKLAYFPGSTIGNFHPHQAVEFMRNVVELVGPGGGFLIGTDLQKDHNVLNLAYNDRKGVTAAFNLNILSHINRECGTNFIEDQFEHLAFYNPTAGRIEMHLVSLIDQVVPINGTRINFQAGERILTEVSYKYTLAGFANMAAQAGFRVQQTWIDPRNYFGVQYLIAK
jgi:dimethylhistidine N-methyltransferase